MHTHPQKQRRTSCEGEASIQVTQAQTKGQFQGQGEVERNDISQNSLAMAKP
jgi:hypothetical protein